MAESPRVLSWFSPKFWGLSSVPGPEQTLNKYYTKEQMDGGVAQGWTDRQTDGGKGSEERGAASIISDRGLLPHGSSSRDLAGTPAGLSSSPSALP